MGCSDLSNIEANSESVILLALLKDCCPGKTWFKYSTLRYMDWSALVHFVLTAEFVYIINFLSRIFLRGFWFVKTTFCKKNFWFISLLSHPSPYLATHFPTKPPISLLSHPSLSELKHAVG